MAGEEFVTKFVQENNMKTIHAPGEPNFYLHFEQTLCGKRIEYVQPKINKDNSYNDVRKNRKTGLNPTCEKCLKILEKRIELLNG